MIIEGYIINYEIDEIDLDDFINEKDLIENFGLKVSMLKRARNKHELPWYQIHNQSPRYYLKMDIRDYLLSYRIRKSLEDI
jgi:hypothetical protein